MLILLDNMGKHRVHACDMLPYAVKFSMMRYAALCGQVQHDGRYTFNHVECIIAVGNRLKPKKNRRLLKNRHKVEG